MRVYPCCDMVVVVGGGVLVDSALLIKDDLKVCKAAFLHLKMKH